MCSKPKLLSAKADARSSAQEAYKMAQQEVNRLWAELQNVEQEIKKQQAKIETAMKTNEMPEIIASIGRERDRLVDEKKDLRHQLSDLQICLATPSGEAPAPKIIDVKEYLVEHYCESLRRVHSEKPPGADRSGERLQTTLELSEQMKLKGRSRTYLSLIANLGRIYRRWKIRKQGADARDFRRGLAHELVLSAPGSGKTTLLECMVRWVREYFYKTKSEERVDFCGWAMYGKPLEEVDDLAQEHVKGFLAALKLMAGGQQHLVAMLRANVPELRTADVECRTHITQRNASAMRLLYALLTPIDSASDLQPPLYDEFVDAMDPQVQQKISISNVMDFVRAALKLPADKEIMLLLMIDEGNAAEGVFPHHDSKQTSDLEGLTWLKQMLSALISQNACAPPETMFLIIPLTVTLRWSAISLRWTESGYARAPYLPMLSLSEEECLEVVLDMARRAAALEGRSAPQKLPVAWRALHAYMGGNPRLLSYLLMHLGHRSSEGHQTSGEEAAFRSSFWNRGLDKRIMGVKPPDVHRLVAAVRDMACGQNNFWPRLLEARGVSRERLHAMLAVIVLDRPVKRLDRILPDVPGVSWGTEEVDGTVKLDLQAPTDGGGDAQLEDVRPIGDLVELPKKGQEFDPNAPGSIFETAGPAAHEAWQRDADASALAQPQQARSAAQQPLPGSAGWAPHQGFTAQMLADALKKGALPGSERTLQEVTDLWCLCKQPYNVNRPMLACDSCNFCYHYDCVGLRPPDDKEDDKDFAPAHFRCPICCIKEHKEYPLLSCMPEQSLLALQAAGICAPVSTGVASLGPGARPHMPDISLPHGNGAPASVPSSNILSAGGLSSSLPQVPVGLQYSLPAPDMGLGLTQQQTQWQQQLLPPSASAALAPSHTKSVAASGLFSHLHASQLQVYGGQRVDTAGGSISGTPSRAAREAWQTAADASELPQPQQAPSGGRPVDTAGGSNSGTPSPAVRKSTRSNKASIKKRQADAALVQPELQRPRVTAPEGRPSPSTEPPLGAAAAACSSSGTPGTAAHQSRKTGAARQPPPERQSVPAQGARPSSSSEPPFDTTAAAFSTPPPHPSSPSATAASGAYQLGAIESATNVYSGSSGGMRSVQRFPVGICEVDLTAISPSKVAIAVGDHLSPVPSAEPGNEPVRASMGLLTFITLLRELGLMRDEDLSPFSDHLVRESALDKEYTDVMAICLRLEALAALGQRTVKLKDLFHGIPLDPQLAAMDFLVPVGKLSVGPREASKLSTEDIERFIKQKGEEIQASVDGDYSKMCCQDLRIGFVGPGNSGEDTGLVLVQADTRQAYCLVVSSKQHIGAKQEYETLRGILWEMHKDLYGSFCLPQLSETWAAWPAKGNDKELPAEQPAKAAWDSSRWEGRVIYAFVSDRVFSSVQQEVREQLIERGHPYIERLLIASRTDAKAWYSRSGALVRGIRLGVLMFKNDFRTGITGDIFREAVANWKKLPDAERKAYTKNFKAAEAAKAGALEKGAPAPDDEEEGEEEEPEAQVEEEAEVEEEEEEEEEEPPKEPTPPPPAPKKEKKRKDKEGADKEAKKKAKKEKVAAAAAAPAAALAPAADAPKKKKRKNKDKAKTTE
ncbi:hypothetical protein COCOBI_05-4810 [Coccomyxa sp. Obi]|nr:hypothetical protein COCOBI_05-4810 [Coccomyxa sp. Obi]